MLKGTENDILLIRFGEIISVLKNRGGIVRNSLLNRIFCKNSYRAAYCNKPGVGTRRALYNLNQLLREF